MSTKADSSNNQILVSCSPYAGGNLPDGDLSSNGPPSMCRSSNASDSENCSGVDGGGVCDTDASPAGLFVVETLLPTSGCDSTVGLPLVFRVLANKLLLLSDGTRNREVEAAEVPVGRFSHHYVTLHREDSPLEGKEVNG